MMMNGIMYAFPMLTSKLQDAGFDSSQVVIAGVLIQLGYGLVSYPFGRFYSSSRLQLSSAAKDRVVSAFACSLVLVSFIIMIGTVAPTEASSERKVNGPVLSFAFLVWGSGLGLSTFHSLSLVNFIFAADKSQRRMGVASMTFALGVGSVLYTLLYHYLLTKLSLMYNFVALFAAYAILTATRLVYMVRGRFEAVPMIEMPEVPTLMRTMSSNAVVRPHVREEGEVGARMHPLRVSTKDSFQSKEALDLTATPPSHPSAMTAQEQATVPSGSSASTISQGQGEARAVASQAPTLYDYLYSRVVWLTSVSIFFGYGVGSAYLSSLGNLASDLNEEEAETVTYYLTLAFLCLIILSRLITTVIYAHMNWPHVLTLWNITLFAGVVVYLSKPTLLGAYLSSALVGLGYGGISSVPAVIATTNFPGASAYYSINLSVVAMVMSLGPFLIGYTETVIYAKSSLAGFHADGAENFGSFIYFLCASCVSTISSYFLGREINKEYKLEQAALLAADEQPPLTAISTSANATSSLRGTIQNNTQPSSSLEIQIR